jgi:hypothetical protein
MATWHTVKLAKERQHPLDCSFLILLDNFTKSAVESKADLFFFALHHGHVFLTGKITRQPKTM